MVRFFNIYRKKLFKYDHLHNFFTEKLNCKTKENCDEISYLDVMSQKQANFMIIDEEKLVSFNFMSNQMKNNYLDIIDRKENEWLSEMAYKLANNN
jgi:hypothetical protein